MADAPPLDEKGILELIAADTNRLAMLLLVGERNLPDWWIGAGFVRSLVWDHLHGFEAETPLRDIDVIYFDPDDTDPARDAEIAAGLAEQIPDLPWPGAVWDVANQARMHTLMDREPFAHARDAIRFWPETATAVAVKLAGGRLIMAAPYGVEDMVNMIVRPTPPFAERPDDWAKRRAEKNWHAFWPKLTFVDP